MIDIREGIGLVIEDDGNWPECARRWIEPIIRIDEIFGIPLTEDILLKCGFILTEKEGFSCSDDVQSDKGYSFKNFNISMRDGRFFMWIDIDEDHWYSFNMVEIKYLHRLQNIFFEHCNEELNIKL
jgi:hypothetical protein